MIYIWIAVIFVFLIIEAATAGLTSIWFAIGAAAALIGAICNGPLWLQIVLFVIVSAAALYFTRPIAKKYIYARKSATNADRVLEMRGVVTEEIDNLHGTGAVNVGGKVWTARSKNGEIIAAGKEIEPLEIDGVKLIVQEKESN